MPLSAAFCYFEVKSLPPFMPETFRAAVKNALKKQRAQKGMKKVVAALDANNLHARGNTFRLYICCLLQHFSERTFSHSTEPLRTSVSWE